MTYFKLRENIYKYMNYMEFIKSASKHTLKHYFLDLEQAFKSAPSGQELTLMSATKNTTPNLTSPISGKELTLASATKNKDLVDFPVQISEEQILTKIREVFSGPWGRLSLASRNRKAATLKSFFGWAHDQGLLTNDLSMHITCPKVPKKIPHFISVDEVMSLLATCEKLEPAEQKIKILFLLLYGGGLRISEACQIRWSDFHTHTHSLRVLGKGNKERIIILPKMVQNSLQQFKVSQSVDFYIWGEKALNTRTAYEMIRQLGIRAQLLKPLHPHALRHSFATHLLSSGANLRTLQEMLGHESLQATEKYTHLGIDQLARTMDQLHPLGRDKARG